MWAILLRRLVTMWTQPWRRTHSGNRAEVSQGCRPHARAAALMTSMATVGIDGQRKKCVGMLAILQALFVCIVRLGHVVVHAHKLEVVACASIVKQLVSHMQCFF